MDTEMTCYESFAEVTEDFYCSAVDVLKINASRLFSCLYGQPLAVGRVMTPVLAMTVL